MLKDNILKFGNKPTNISTKLQFIRKAC